MKDKIITQCYPKKEPIISVIFAYLAGVLVFGSIIGLAIYFITGLFIDFYKLEDYKKIFFIAGWVFSAVILPFILMRKKYKYYWYLTENHLIQGQSQSNQYSFSDIDKVIIGLPKETNILFKITILSPLSETLKTLRQNTMVIKFKNGSFLPLCLLLYENGNEFTNTFKTILKDLIYNNYEYSKPEINLLKYADFNKLTKKI